MACAAQLAAAADDFGTAGAGFIQVMPGFATRLRAFADAQLTGFSGAIRSISACFTAADAIIRDMNRTAQENAQGMLQLGITGGFVDESDIDFSPRSP